MLLAASILLMLIVAYAQYRNGLSSSIFMLIAVLLSGVVAFNFWEPVADFLEPHLQGGALHGCEDLLALVTIFGVTLLLLRVAMYNYLAQDMIDQHGHLQFFGASGVGFITGYFAAGFLVCALQTLPLDVAFLDFESRSGAESPWRVYVPPDRVWLALMRHAGTYPLNWKEKDENQKGETMHDRYVTFDPQATFELRYLRYRRNSETRGPMPYLGEFDKELYGKLKPR